MKQQFLAFGVKSITPAVPHRNVCADLKMPGVPSRNLAGKKHVFNVRQMKPSVPWLQSCCTQPCTGKPWEVRVLLLQPVENSAVRLYYLSDQSTECNTSCAARPVLGMRFVPKPKVMFILSNALFKRKILIGTSQVQHSQLQLCS